MQIWPIKKKRKKNKRSGQTAVEYILLLAVLTSVLVAGRKAMMEPLNQFFSIYVRGFSNTYNPETSASTGGKDFTLYYLNGGSPAPTSTVKVR